MPTVFQICRNLEKRCCGRGSCYSNKLSLRYLSNSCSKRKLIVGRFDRENLFCSWWRPSKSKLPTINFFLLRELLRYLREGEKRMLNNLPPKDVCARVRDISTACMYTVCCWHQNYVHMYVHILVTIVWTEYHWTSVPCTSSSSHVFLPKHKNHLA